MKVESYRFSIAFVTALLGVGVFVTIVFFTAIHFNPVQNNHNFKRLVFSLVPQGWAFFTRNPREAQTLIYQVVDNELELLEHRHSSMHNFVGLKRTSSVYLSEMQIIRTKLQDRDFQNTQWNYQANLTGEFPEEKVKVENIVANPVLCGDYVMVFQKPVPWAWSKSIDKIKMPAKVVRVEIECI